MGLERFTELLRRGMMIAGGVALLALTLLATMNVALRIFRVPVGGTYEVVSFLGAIVTAGASVTPRNGRITSSSTSSRTSSRPRSSGSSTG